MVKFGGFWAALLFGFADAVQGKMQSVLRVALPPEVLQMALLHPDHDCAGGGYRPGHPARRRQAV
ncbi:MAG: hypothetical protein NUW24_00590 [Anaerolineae bacterium]|jgi:hypothetical protein|nr:hypothetical protein [Anaerolineae bacterium]MDH7472515.1 hypothetical protein [Anaerolineae bacterium]